MPPSSIPICASTDLVDGGLGVRFDVGIDLGERVEPATGFVIRHRGVARAWLNQCRHVPMELDWIEGRFFDPLGQVLLCSTHGAQYEPDTGLCIAGPCVGQRLRALDVVEIDATVCWRPDHVFVPLFR